MDTLLWGIGIFVFAGLMDVAYVSWREKIISENTPPHQR